MSKQYVKLDKPPFRWGYWGALIIVILLALCDVYAVNDMFITLNMTRRDSMILSIMAAMIMEGLPTYMGMAIAKLRDKGRYEENVPGWFSIAFAFVVMAAAWFLVGWLRAQMLAYQEAAGLFDGRRSADKFGPTFLIYSPVLTSLGALLISWFAMRGSALSDKQRETYRAQERFLAAEEAFHEAYNRCMEARATVWTSVADTDETEMPAGFEAFRRECFSRLRNKLVDNCLTTYPTQIERYTADVGAKLEGYLLEIANRSTLPQQITAISLEALLRKHDEEAKDKADCWDYNLSGPDLENELRRSIDAAVIVSQYKTALNPYYMEKER